MRQPEEIAEFSAPKMEARKTRKRGLTSQRKVVLDVVRESNAHLNASEVFAAAKGKQPGISFATVYNSLRYLKASGHIAEIPFGNGASRFDGITESHDHAICNQCDKLVDIKLEHPGDLMRIAQDYSGFEGSSLEFTLRGICPECKQKNSQA
jgi:Fur family transcriptional regulator, peroxide stress response regulator